MEFLSKISHFIPVDNGRVWVHPDYASVVAEHHLENFSSWMEYSGGQTYKKNRHREIVKILSENSPPLFLKRHFRPAFKESMAAWMHGQKPKSAARCELEAIFHLEETGIRTLEPVAIGEFSHSLKEAPSFLVTKEMPGIKALQYIESHKERWFQDLGFHDILVRKVAQMARAMHESGIHHQDFYLAHIFIDDVSGSPEVGILDVQRLQKRKHLSIRWRIKDLAQLNYSALPQYFTTMDRVRFWKYYKGEEKLSALGRNWIGKIWRRCCKIADHQANRERRNRPPSNPIKEMS